MPEFEDELIEVDGLTTDGSAFNDWLGLLQSFEWVGEVKVLGFSEMGNDNAFGLELRIE
ncbi:MAG: hypothetical protein AAF705_04765 [Bacteroidota bacterium]